MLYNSTLGYIQNPLLEKYHQLFLVKLQNLWKAHISIEIPPSHFLLFPDIHGLLLAGIRPGNPKKNQLFDVLAREYLMYKKQENRFRYNPEQIIPGTSILLTLDFYNPDVEQHAHPEHKKNDIGISFGSKNEHEWREMFASSFSILAKVSPGYVDEINKIIRKIIPFDVSYKVHNSGSYSDVIGHLIMSYPTGMDQPELALLEAILHEYNHNKLNIILQTESLVLNDRSEKYYSPYRPDARHIHGIYLGLHAIVGAYWVIWRAHKSGIITLSEVWQEKALLYTLKNGLSIQVLDKYAHLSLLGKQIFEEMKQIHRECLSYIQEIGIKQPIIDRAKNSLIEHYKQAQSQNPGIYS